MTRILTIIGGWILIFAIWRVARRQDRARVRTILKTESDFPIIGDGAWNAPPDRTRERKHQRICTCNREPMGA